MDAIDLFAGCGGTTTGATAAGARVLWAANHWPAAVQVHANNHPHTLHACQDLHQADWSQVPQHDLLLASPACTGHTRARGKDRPHHDAARSTAWAVVSCAEYHRPRFVLVENVPEFRRWALYPSWVDAMQRLGYTLDEHVIDAADAGVPQHRRRLFVLGVRGRLALPVRHPQRQHVPISSVIDWHGGNWTSVTQRTRALAASTLRRIEAGRRVHGDRFLVSYYGAEQGGRSVNRPVGTITTVDRHAVIDGDRMRMLSARECAAAQGFPQDYQLTGNHRTDVKLIGNAVAPPVAEWMVRQILEAA